MPCGCQGQRRINIASNKVPVTPNSSLIQTMKQPSSQVATAGPVVPKVAPQVSQKVIPTEIPKVVPKETPKTVVPKVVPQVIPKVTPQVIPKVVPQVVPKAIPHVIPTENPKVVPKQVSANPEDIVKTITSQNNILRNRYNIIYNRYPLLGSQLPHGNKLSPFHVSQIQEILNRKRA